MAFNPDDPLNYVGSPRACIRNAIKECLRLAPGMTVDCERYDCWKVPADINKETCGVNIRTTGLSVDSSAAVIQRGGVGLGDPNTGFCAGGGCLGTDKIVLSIEIEISAIACEDALIKAERCAAVISKLICQHQCDLPLSKISYSSSNTSSSNEGENEFVLLTESYEAEYNYNHCQAKIGRVKC